MVVLAVIVFYVLFGLICCIGFGPEARMVLTTSLPDCLLASSVQLAYSLAVVLTFPLQNFPALEITLQAVQYGCNQRWPAFRFSRNILSSMLVVLLATIAVCTMDSLDKVVSIMGSLIGCPIAFVFPPLIHSSVVRDISKKRLWSNRVLVAFGLGAMISASVVTILS
jgi:solute carrier family 36 (proton-coupled amino acid transporter)